MTFTSSFYVAVTVSTRGTESLLIIYAHFCSHELLLLKLEHQHKNAETFNSVHKEKKHIFLNRNWLSISALPHQKKYGCTLIMSK